ncbi:MAG: glycogen/starch/alpha-glucan phosphorylase [Eubacteriaceae bacterium]|jgi:starch phosphorylase
MKSKTSTAKTAPVTSTVPKEENTKSEAASNVVIPQRKGVSPQVFTDVTPSKRRIEKFKEQFVDTVESVSGHPFSESTPAQQYRALSQIVMEQINKNWVAQNETYYASDEKQIYFFSIEFLIGRMLRLYVNSLGWCDLVPGALNELGIDYDELQKMEQDPALGNGGLGRLMACFLDSTAAMGFPGHGNGIRYKYGLFEQKIVNNEQVEVADNWLKNGDYPFEIRNKEKAVIVKYGGEVVPTEVEGKTVFIQKNYEPILAVPYDIPIQGFHNNTVNSLRLWSAEPVEEFDLETFNSGQFLKAVQNKSDAEAISQILYPSDAGFEGRLLRLKQEYFFVCAGLKRIIRRYKKQHNGSVKGFQDHIIIHINDTHPAMAVPELMRILIDEEGLGWDEAWKITNESITFTNHTVLPEALEKWPIDMMQQLLPRIYQIIEEINRRFLVEMNEKHPDNEARNYSCSILKDGNVHMAHLSIIGSHSVNGVAELHSKILREETFHGFYELMPEKFTNVTNGVTQRRFMFSANPELRKLINKKIGDEWNNASEMTRLEKLTDYKDDSKFLEELAAVKLANKKRLAKHIEATQGIKINPESIYDIQVKRIHEYKRQLLNILHVMSLYNKLKENPDMDFVPKTFIFAGKSAPSYTYAKEVIRLINTVSEKINADPDMKDRLSVVFLPNFNVSLAEIVYPAAEISEQISTAGKEASGTGNMKFMMNGAITLGTMDGANIEIKENVGDDNIFTFGISDQQVYEYTHNGGYRSLDYYEQDDRIRKVLNQLVDGTYSGQPFTMIYDSLLLNNDCYFVLRDFDDYAAKQQEVSDAYKDRERWQKMSLENIAHSGVFSSDRSIEDYKTNVWKIK